MSIGDLDRRILWVRAGGRCTLCKKYLLEGDLSAKEVPLGEAAHIVGQTVSANSPRGKHSLPADERDEVDNVMLACPSCHTEVDKQLVAETLDVEFLREKKRQHETAIKFQTGLIHDDRTAVLRMAGDIRGDVMELPRRAASEAVLQSAKRFPYFLESYDRQGVEIDLQHLSGEHPITDAYYQLAKSQIDVAIEQRVHPGIRNGDITHLSVFALARVPLLVYLGAKLDDGSVLDVYQRHRTTQSWAWPRDDDAGTTFNVQAAEPALEGTDGVLITNLSGTTATGELPEHVRHLPIWTLTASTGPGEDVIGDAATLDRFAATVREFFTGLEQTHKQLGRLHLFGALPASTAVVFGQVLKSDGLRPTVVTYDRTSDGYRRALEI